MDLLTLIFFSFLAASLICVFTWWVCVKIDNYSLIDAVWAFLFVLMSPMLVIYSHGYPPRKIVLAIMFMLWGGRLSMHLFKRILGHLEREDTRYQALRTEYGANVKRRFFIFFQYQALSVVILLLPMWVVSQNTEALTHPFEILGLGLWMIGIVGESISDRQLAHFAKTSTDKMQVCKIGLWRYSRHPNYFFEAVLWLGYALYASGSPHGYLAWIATGIIWFLLLKVTGIPYAEAQSLKKRGDAYRQYQRETSAFFPLPPKL